MFRVNLKQVTQFPFLSGRALADSPCAGWLLPDGI
jgi:hypothetical protein